MALVLWNNKELRIHELYEHESKKKMVYVLQNILIIVVSILFYTLVLLQFY